MRCIFDCDSLELKTVQSIQVSSSNGFFLPVFSSNELSLVGGLMSLPPNEGNLNPSPWGFDPLTFLDVFGEVSYIYIYIIYTYKLYEG